MQVANFVVAGVLSGAFAVRLVVGGLFRPDPALGCQVGTPDEVPDSISWHGWLHAVAPPLAFTALVAAAVVLARRDRFLGRWCCAPYSAATAAAALLVTAWPHPDSISWRLAIGVVVGFAWLTALAVRERAALVSWEAEQEAVAA